MESMKYLHLHLVPISSLHVNRYTYQVISMLQNHENGPTMLSAYPVYVIWSCQHDVLKRRWNYGYVTQTIREIKGLNTYLKVWISEFSSRYAPRTKKMVSPCPPQSQPHNFLRASPVFAVMSFCDLDNVITQYSIDMKISLIYIWLLRTTMSFCVESLCFLFILCPCLIISRVIHLVSYLVVNLQMIL